MSKVSWKSEPDEHDYPAATAYPSLIGDTAQIADGYHRVCASYHIDENTDIPCHVVDRGGRRS